MATPEMLLFLDGKMGLEWRHICTDAGSEGRVVYGVGGYCIFNPARDPAQFGRLLLWAALNGLEPMLAKRHAFAGLVGTSSDYTQAHDSTEAGIMAAATLAIARALGWEGGA